MNNKLSKENLILVQAYPANETITHGAIELLEQYYNVFFINYPGFHSKAQKLDSYEFEDLVLYVEQKIDELGLESYILGGASFGFSIVNNVQIDEDKCLAIYGLLPYLGKDYHTMSPKRWRLMKYILDAIEFNDYYIKFWGEEKIERVLKNVVGKGNKDFMSNFFNDVDPIAFMEVSRTVLSYNRKPKFHKDIPYLIIISPEDETVNYSKTITKMLKDIPNENLRIIPINMPHFPPDLSYEYFRNNITEREFNSALQYVYDIKK